MERKTRVNYQISINMFGSSRKG